MKRKTAIGMALLVSALSTGAWAQAGAKDEKGKDKAKSSQPSQGQSAPAPVASPDYVIGADDTLHISVWKEPDLTATLPVRPDGKISMPLLDDVQAAGLTPMQLAAAMTEKLKKYIADPRVTAVVTAMNSQRLFVLGN